MEILAGLVKKSASTILLSCAALALYATTALAQTQTVTLTLGWTDNSNSPSNSETKFEVERCAGANCTTFAKVGEVGQNITAYKDVITFDTGGITYCYRVRAVNAAGISTYSNTACGTSNVIITVPPAPSGLTIQGVTVSSVDLKWQNESATMARNDIEGRRAGQSYSFFGGLDGAAESVRVSGLRRNSSYNFRIRRCESNCSEYANFPAVKTLR